MVAVVERLGALPITISGVVSEDLKKIDGVQVGSTVVNSTAALNVAQSGTNYVFSTNNSSTSQLAASATFTGTVESVVNQQSYSILLTSDQPITLTILQYIDAAGTKLASTLTYNITAGAGFARSGVLNGNYVKITAQNTGGSTTTTFRVDTAYGTIPSATQLNNAPTSINEVNGTAISLGQTTMASSLPVTLASNQTPVTVQQSTASNLKVDLSGTAANATAIKVDGSAVTQPVSGTVTAIGGTVVATATTTASQTGVIIASTDISAYGSISLQMTGSPSGLTATIDMSNDNTNWISVPIDNPAGVTIGAQSTSFNSASIYNAQRFGKYVRVNFSANTSAGALVLTLIGFAQNTIPHWQTVYAAAVGNVASGASDSGNPVKIGGIAINAEATAVTNGQRVNAVCDLVGKQIVMPYANKENFISGVATSTGTTDTSVIAAAGAGVKNYITGVSVYNSGATTSVITIKNGSGGGTLWQTIAPASGGSNFIISPPIATSANTALYFASGSASTTVGISATGYKGS